jgi:hypothetical protein
LKCFKRGCHRGITKIARICCAVKIRNSLKHRV